MERNVNFIRKNKRKRDLIQAGVCPLERVNHSIVNYCLSAGADMTLNAIMIACNYTKICRVLYLSVSYKGVFMDAPSFTEYTEYIDYIK